MGAFSSSGEAQDINEFKSTANNQVRFSFSVQFIISFLYIWKSKDLNTEPCGTPSLIQA